MKIECPVCFEEIELNRLKDSNEIVCPHCHFKIVLDEMAVNMANVFMVGLLMIFVVIYSVLQAFIDSEKLMISMMLIFFLVMWAQLPLRIVKVLGLLRYSRKEDKEL